MSVKGLTALRTLMVGTALAAGFAVGTPGTARAEAGDDWSFQVAPYFWMAGQSGDIGAFGVEPFESDLSFGDIFDNLDFSAMVAGEARYGKFSILTDFLYLKISSGTALPFGYLADYASADSRVIEASLLGGYNLLDDHGARVDVVAGPRIWSVKDDIKFTGGFLNGRKFKDSATWADVMAGFRVRYNITPQVFATGWALGGGGGSRFGWDAMGAVGYRFSDGISALAGYRGAGVDYRKDGFVYDVTIQGPVLGVSFQF